MQSEIYLDQDMTISESLFLADCELQVFSKKCHDRSDNQDAIVVVGHEDGPVVVGLADGAGGHKNGAWASKVAMEALRSSLSGASTAQERRVQILDAFEEANNRIIRDANGAATTMVVAEVSENKARVYFAGDSICLVVGGRGKLKYRTYGHNPVDLGIQAGLLDEDVYDEQGLRHIVTNMLGSKQLHIESSVQLSLDPKDTLLICSDGLYDNVKLEEICSILSGSDLTKIADTLQTKASQAMHSQDDEFSKHDDLSFVLVRRK